MFLYLFIFPLTVGGGGVRPSVENYTIFYFCLKPCLNDLIKHEKKIILQKYSYISQEILHGNRAPLFLPTGREKLMDTLVLTTSQTYIHIA